MYGQVTHRRKKKEERGKYRDRQITAGSRG
jgi:hypothetical protein